MVRAHAAPVAGAAPGARGVVLLLPDGAPYIGPHRNLPGHLFALDLKGGLRLVYTVDVEEAIKDKRDRYFDEVRSHWETIKAVSFGEAGPENLPSWQKYKRPQPAFDSDLDDDVPF